jgi:hypothetical protein
MPQNLSLSTLAQFYQTQGKHYTGAIVSLGLSGALWCIAPNSNLAVAFGITGIIASTGYGFGIATTSQKLKQYSDLLEENWANHLVTIEAQWESKLKQALSVAQSHHQNLESAKAELKEAIAKLKESHAERDEWQARANRLSAQLEAYKAQFDHALSVAQTLLEAEYDRKLEVAKESNYRLYLEKIKAKNSEHRSREQFLLNELQQLEAVHKAKAEDTIGKYEALLAEGQSIIDQQQAVLNAYSPELKVIHASFQQQMQSVTEERDRIYAQLQRYHAARRFTGSTKADINGNRLIDFFLEQGMTCDADHCASHVEYDEVWIRPRTNTLEALEKCASAIQLQFELLKKPEFGIEQGCVKVILRTHTKEKTASTTTISEPPENWLEEVARQSNHYRISAPTDWGKSTLLDNLINCLRLLHGDEFRYDLLDPKYPFTEWTGGIKPTYTKFVGCIAGMEMLGSLIEGRIAEAEADIKAGRSIREYPAHLFAIDELEVMVDEARDLDDGATRGKQSMRLARLLRKGLKLGRGVTTRKGKGVIVAYITQSPLCSRINLNKDDFDNSTNLFIADNIPRALSEELSSKLSDKEIAYLMKQYELRKERGDEYICLVKLPKSKTTAEAFIATLPPPGYYAQKLIQEIAEATESLDALTNANLDTAVSVAGAEHPSLESRYQQDFIDLAPQTLPAPIVEEQPPVEGGCFEIQCPGCNSLRIKRNGKKRGVQYYQCFECSKQFSV